MHRPTSHSILSRKQRRAIILSLGIAASVYLTVVFVSGYEDILQALQRFGPLYWLLVLSCSLCNYILRFLRWQFYLRKTEHDIPIRQHFLIYLAGFALTTTPGKAGETIRSVLLRPYGVSYPVSLACFFTERFLDVIVIALLASLTVLAFNDYGRFVVLSSLAIISLLPLLRSSLFLSYLVRLENSISAEKIRLTLTHLISLLRNAQQFLSWRLLSMGMSLGLVAWVIQGLAFYLIVTQLNFEINLWVALGIYSISLLAGAISFIPGGVGSTEVVMGLLLASLGADTSIVVSAPLISRLSTLWFAVVLGLFSSSYLSTQKATL